MQAQLGACVGAAPWLEALRCGDTPTQLMMFTDCVRLCHPPQHAGRHAADAWLGCPGWGRRQCGVPPHAHHRGRSASLLRVPTLTCLPACHVTPCCSAGAQQSMGWVGGGSGGGGGGDDATAGGELLREVSLLSPQALSAGLRDWLVDLQARGAAAALQALFLASAVHVCDAPSRSVHHLPATGTQPPATHPPTCLLCCRRSNSCGGPTGLCRSWGRVPGERLHSWRF